MKRIHGIGIIVAVLGVVSILSMSVAAIEPRNTELESQSVVTSTEESNQDDTDKQEIVPTFVGEDSATDDSMRLWAGKNLLVAGNNIDNDIKVPTGLMLVAGNNLDLRGEAEYGFLLGNNIVFAGKTVRDLYIAGNSVTLSSEARIGRDVFSSSASLLVETDLPGDLSAVAAQVELKDIRVAGNLNLTADKIIIRGKVEVAGKLVYNDNAHVQGLQNIVASETETFHVEEVSQTAIILTKIYSKIMSITALFLAMVVIYFLWPRLHQNVEAAETIDRFGSTLVRGLAVFLVIPLAAILAFVTYLAAPLGIIAILLYFILMYIAQGFAGLWVGHMIIEKAFKSKTHVLIEALVGIIVLGALALIPYVGVITGFLGMMLGLGLMFNSIKPLKAQNQKATEEE